MKLKELKKGEMFMLREPKENEQIKSSMIYTKGDYDRSTKKYICGRWDDISYSRELKGDREIYLDFVF